MYRRILPLGLSIALAFGGSLCGQDAPHGKKAESGGNSEEPLRAVMQIYRNNGNQGLDRTVSRNYFADIPVFGRPPFYIEETTVPNKSALTEEELGATVWIIHNIDIDSFLFYPRDKTLFKANNLTSKLECYSLYRKELDEAIERHEGLEDPKSSEEATGIISLVDDAIGRGRKEISAGKVTGKFMLVGSSNVWAVYDMSSDKHYIFYPENRELKITDPLQSRLRKKLCIDSWELYRLAGLREGLVGPICPENDTEESGRVRKFVDSVIARNPEESLPKGFKRDVLSIQIREE